MFKKEDNTQSGNRMKEPLIIGRSPAIKNLNLFITKAEASDSNVLILGETGVGKGLAARAIHFGSKRRNHSFIEINCAELNENLAESELFGHRRGAFTGASFDRPGLIEAATGGTFFFNEICDIGPGLQAKLLSAIEDKAVRRVGENYPRRIDARFMFATNKDLHSLVAKGKFRGDLFYRISVLTINIPPLRERTIDIPLLIESFMEKESQERSLKIELTPEAVKKICEYKFPGNVRELQNILTRACDLSSGGIIQEHDISFDAIPESNQKIRKSKYRIEEIIKIVIRCEGNITKAAKALGISRVHLYRLLHKEGINLRK